MLSPEAKKNKVDYIDSYNKENYKSFFVRIDKETAKRIETYCKWADISKAEFLRQAIEALD